MSALSCAPKLQSQSTIPSEPRRIVRTAGDTAYYTVEFADAKERRKFVDGVDNLVDKYSRRMETDTVGAYVRIRVLPARSESVPVDSPQAPAIAEAFPPQPVSFEQPADTEPPPVRGGAIAFYSHRAYLDDNLLRLVQPDPFAGDTSARPGDSTGRCPPLLRVDQVSAKRLRLILPDRLVNGAGQRISALDVVDAWNAQTRTAPARTRGLFRNVGGLEGILRGTEAVLRGVQGSDERTIAVTFAADDAANEPRLHAPDLLPASLKLGRYFVKETRGAVTVLGANASYPCEKAFLDKITLTLGGDANPLLSLSLGKYDVMTLYAARDVEYARAKLADKTALTELSRDHYFLSVANPSAELRAFVRDGLRPADMLARSVKASGSLLSTITDTIAPGPAAGAFIKQAPPQPRPLTVVLLKDDPVSVSIGDFLLAELTRAGIPCQLKPGDPTAYEQALASRGYDIAVGWVPRASLGSAGEQARIAARWFGDQGDETARLQESREIPLFAVTTWALCKRGVALHHGDIAGLCRVAQPQ